MPLMDGCELTRKIREAEETQGSHIPIIGTTDHAMADDIQLYRDSGMNGHWPNLQHWMTLKIS